MRLTFVISHLGCGGAQRVMSILANAWATKGWRITLLTLDNGEERPFYDLHPAVMYRPLIVSRASPTSMHAIFNNLKRLWVLRQAIKQSSPHVVISFMDMPNVLTILATLGLSLPVIISERTDPSPSSDRQGMGALATLGVSILHTFSRPNLICLVVLFGQGATACTGDSEPCAIA